MKFLLSTLILLFAFQGSAEMSMLDLLLKNRVPNAVYTPMGFDDNDNVELVFEGYYPNACYKVGLSYSDVNHEKKEIRIVDQAMHHGHDFCAEVIVPYTKEVSFGRLEIGKYKIFFQDEKDGWVRNGTLNVSKAATTTIDDHLYAPVDQIIFKAAKDGAPPTLTVEGSFISNCMELEKVEMKVYEGSTTVDILPIAKIDNPDKCSQKMTPTSYSSVVDLSPLPEGRQLLHIRALNGKAINRIIHL